MPEKILVVEDEPSLQETLVYNLRKQGYEVEAVSEGNLAVEKARTYGPDVIILDIMLPGKNGYEVSRILKEEMEQGKVAPFPILVLTARKVASPEREDFLKTWSKADEFMYKPFDMKRLMECIALHLERSGVAEAR